MKYGNVFWGALLVMTGALFGLRNFGVIDFSWYSLFRLWPLLLVLWGITVLPVRSGYKVLFSVLAVGFAIAIIVRYPNSRFKIFDRGWVEWHSDRHDREDDAWKEQHFTESYDTLTKSVSLSLDIAAGSFTLEDETELLFKFDHEGRAGRYKMDTEKEKGHTSIRLSLDDVIGNGKLKSSSNLSLNINPIWSIDIDAAASDTDLDLSAFRVEKLELDGGASDITIKLGMLVEKSYINIDAAATSLNLILPREAACEIKTSTILSSRDFEGFEKIEKGLYRTPGYSDQASHRIIVDLDAAVSGVNVELYSAATSP